jgi:acyl transferase domain-containing protein
MLQAKEIERRFRTAGQAIAQAAQASSAERNLPGELRKCIQRLDQEADTAPQVFRSLDEARIRKLMGTLDSLGQRARQVCLSGVRITPQMNGAVHRMVEELAALKQEFD